MTSDEELIAAIIADEATPKKKKSQPIKEDVVVVGDPQRRVFVRCVTDLQPWADGKPLHYWQDYEITMQDAALLESRKHAVILEAPQKGN